MAISFATFNLENLQLPGVATYPNSKPLTEKQFDRRCEWLADQLIAIDADVVGFQELWDRKALERVFAHPDLASQGYELITSPDTGRINNALAVRAPVVKTHSMWFEDFPADLSLNSRDQQIKLTVRKFGRKVLRVKLTPAPEGARQPKDIVVMVAHLKSKRPSDVDFKSGQSARSVDRGVMGQAISQVRRAAEAAALRVLISNALEAGERVVVMGDLNDSQFAVTTDMLGAGARYRLDPSSNVASKAKWAMYSIATLQELRSLRDVYYTYIYQGFRDSLDHILVSQHFYDYSKNREWAFHRARLFNDHLEDQQTKNWSSPVL